MKKLLSFFLSIVFIFTLFPKTVLAEETEQNLEDIIREQVEAYAKSIDQKDADSKAADKLAAHGITGKGKKLTADKSHPLTATLFNSNLLKVTLTEGLTSSIKSMQGMDITNLSLICGNICWYGADSFYLFNVSTSDSNNYVDRDWELIGTTYYTGTRNAYDNSLDWIAGNTASNISIEKVKVTKTEETYSVKIKVYDRFDFDTSNNSGFAGLISGIGALLFKEFDWESNVTLSLTVPDSCTHSSGSYHWTYDKENNMFISDNSENYTENIATRHSYILTSGKETFYYAVDETVRLYHNNPWVIEYTVAKPSDFLFSSTEKYPSKTKPSLAHLNSKAGVFILNREHVTVDEKIVEECNLSNNRQHITHGYGTNFRDLFSYSPSKLHTFRYENKVNPDGSNMIYLTVIKTETGEILAEKIPMDDYYRYEHWLPKEGYVLLDESNDWVNGKDLYINYLGNQDFPLSANYFDLYIWENGRDAEDISYFEKTASTSATCTEKGSVTYTCALCNYSYSESVDPTGHSFGEWYETKAPTAKENGEEKRDCKTCGASETRLTEKLACLFGDVSGDGKINVVDANLARKAAAKLESLDEAQKLAADVNGDGKVNVVDANLIRKYAAKMINIFPVEQ